MATCPRCGKFLDDDHRCVGVWRMHLRALRAIAAGGFAGAIIGELSFMTVSGRTSWLAVAMAGITGMAIVIAVQRGEPH
jgi:hypothetical protein